MLFYLLLCLPFLAAKVFSELCVKNADFFGADFILAVAVAAILAAKRHFKCIWCVEKKGGQRGYYRGAARNERSRGVGNPL